MDLNTPLVPLAEAVGGAVAAWEDAVAGCPFARDAQADAEAMTDAGLLQVLDEFAAVRRHVDAMLARVAAEVVSRSRAELGSEGLARRAGYRSPVTLVSAALGAHPGDAARLARVGDAIAERMLFSGERAPARHPHLAVAVAEGRLSTAFSAEIASMLDQVALRADPAQLDRTERLLAERASVLGWKELGVLLARARAHLDPDGVAPDTRERHHRRGLRVWEDQDGMIRFDGAADPETGAPIKAAIEAIVTHALRTHRGHNSPDGVEIDEHDGDRSGGDHEPEPAVAETRTVAQIQIDALAMICRHALGCDRSGSALANTTVIVRIPLDALTGGEGVAEIDGIARPVDAGAVRRMAGNAEIVPCVLGGDSEVLDFGVRRRPFTRAQRLALEERDGGCASCGLPGSFAEAHHLTWWSAGGATDLENGALLCTACHHRIHDQGWRIRIDPPPSGNVTGGTVWFIPPPDIDPRGTPRIGGRARFGWPAAA